ncbi:phospholipid-transporting ATPase ABCA3 [Rhipicephalus microplus]|uniref:phospholipid-transporting ATPase ABCA3 n=1 Tax=Rhipicephalus microplus TaxID=6941 RepID=UPI003F6B8C8A
MPKELSGGMKRRLSMAMTLVSEPDLLILDEPSAGMDPETRRNVWDILQKVAKQRTLLLSSHDMEEADAIADQIVIMAAGVVVCTGSTTFLKKACGVGYKVTFTKVPQVFKLHDAMAVVQRTIPHAVVDDDKKEEVCITLGTMENENFPGMFRMLEGSMRRLGISSIGVSVASMKDVYLKINMDWAPGGKGREDPVDEKVIEAVSKPISKQRTMTRSFSALFYKRLLSLVRSWDLYVVFFLGPLVLLALATWLRPQQSLLKTLKKQEETLDVPIKLGTHFPDSTVVLGEAPATNLSKALRVLIESESCTVRATGNVTKELHEIIENDFAAYILTYPMAVAFQSNTIRMMPNPTSAITSPIIINLVYTAWLRVLAAQPTLQNNITVTYLVAVPFEPLLALFIERVVSWLYWVIVAALTYMMSFAAYASFPVDERLGGARDVQLMTGISGTEFIFAHFVFDFACHFVYCASWCTIHYAFSFYSLGTAALLFGALLSFGPVAIGVCYVKAEYSSASGSAVGSVFLWFYIGGAIVTAASTFFVLLGWPEYTQVLLYGVPPYALLSLLNKIWNNEDKSLQCKELQKEGIKLPRGIGPNCDEGLLQFSTDGVGFELAFLLAEGLLFLAYMIFKTSGYLSAGDPSPGDEAAADEDVAEEAKKVEAAVQKGDYVSNSMLVWRLHKHFGALHAVRGIYMALRPSECFGLLGVNGAGKTTTFQMLAALISVSYGDASTAVAKLSANARRWQSQVSYCFQLGGLLDRLNAYEYLYLVGRLRGITESDLKPMVGSVIAVVDLTEHASKQCGVYSGGNRRKLSIGAALLGLQPFIFLDEPYAGVDVVSRNKIFRAIAEIKKRSKSTFVLTSHNMDECEFSCDRITIMVEGHMMCLGTLQHLREKFGKGFRLEFLLKHTAAADAPMLNAAVKQLFRGIELKQCHQNLLCYHLAVRVPWSEIFTKVVDLQKNFQLEHALVAENTLEDIFLNFAKAQEAATMAATANAAPPTAHPRQSPSTGAPASAAASTSPA